MASHKLRHACRKQEALHALPSVRTNDDQIGMPLCGRVDDLLSDVTLQTAVSTLKPPVRQRLSGPARPVLAPLDLVLPAQGA